MKHHKRNFIDVKVSKIMEGQDHETRDEDIETVRRCQEGSIDDFEYLVRKYQKKIFNIAYRMTGDYDEAADVAQDAFVSAYRGLRSFEGHSRFSTWLCAITINLSRNRIRQVHARTGKEQFSLDDPAPSGQGKGKREIASKEPSALDRLETAERQRMVSGCIEGLEREFREVIILRDLQGFSYTEIGEILNISGGTVRSRIHRARESLRNCLKNSMGDQ